MARAIGVKKKVSRKKGDPSTKTTTRQISKKTGTGGLGQAAAAIRARRAAERALLGN